MDTVILGMMSLSQVWLLPASLHEMHHRYRQRLCGSSCFLGIKVCTMALLNVSHPVGHLATDLVMQDSNINSCNPTKVRSSRRSTDALESLLLTKNELV